ncbi:hypothetical protein FRAHR75_390016 [Frankia sp. Hr75.2]|nr:hypothetical protein FRAHR75_390016 [Frankia sp. Hr75.2]
MAIQRYGSPGAASARRRPFVRRVGASLTALVPRTDHGGTPPTGGILWPAALHAKNDGWVKTTRVLSARVIRELLGFTATLMDEYWVRCSWTRRPAGLPGWDPCQCRYGWASGGISPSTGFMASRSVPPLALPDSMTTTTWALCYASSSGA